MADQRRVMVLGAGAREHALCWRLSTSPHVGKLWCAPGNAGTEAIATSVPLDILDIDAVKACVRELSVDFVVVGPEAPLVQGVVDALGDVGVTAFGPSKAAARLEGSKVFAKQFMQRWKIPTASFEVFEDASEALRYVRAERRPLVIKADGLAAGKGVVVASNQQEAEEAVHYIMEARAFGEAGNAIVIEERLCGPEVSYHVISDGECAVPLAAAQDHKRLLEGDRGPNTGGMGAYSPTPVVTLAMEETIRTHVVEPTLKGMKAEGQPFRGALFVGLMIVEGKPMVLEYNVRLGDPETEVLLARYQGDLLSLLEKAACGSLAHEVPQWEAPAALCVVLASGGYPGAGPQGLPITGFEDACKVPGVQVFHAGTRKEHGRIVTAGGRVLTVTAVGETMESAADRAYRAASELQFEGAQFRRDIGAGVLGPL